jgi:hypothetical protein
MRHLRIFVQAGKYGLADEDAVLLQPDYTSLEITNNAPPEYQLSNFADDPSVYLVEEVNFPIIIADGKQGLAGGIRRLKLDLIYDRIIKLTYSHYLCQVSTAWTLYEFTQSDDTATKVTVAGEMTLEKLVQALAETAPQAHKALMKKLQPTSKRGMYISEYRCYWGDQNIGVFHGFLAGITHAMITNEFQVTPA